MADAKFVFFVPAERVRRARRGTEGAHRAPQTLPRPDRLLILPTPSTHRHTALSPPTAASSYPPSLSPSLGKRSGGQQSRRAASLSLALVFCFFLMPPVVTELGGPQVGRMATTDRRSEKWNLDPGLFSVVIGVPPAPATLQPSGTRGSAGTIKENEYSMVFYRAKADALDESSHLQGRTEGTEITSARRSRAVGGVFKMTMKQLGGLGVGRVAGYLHPARSTTQPLAQQAPSPGSAAPKEDDAGRVARMEACNNLTPKYVGATTQGFPCSVPAIGLAPAHIDRLHAKIVYTATIADAAGPQGSLGDPSFNVHIVAPPLQENPAALLCALRRPRRRAPAATCCPEPRLCRLKPANERWSTRFA